MKQLFENIEIWFVTGSQHLYGPQTLEQVDANTRSIVGALNESHRLPVKIVGRGVMKSPEEVRAICVEANSSPGCAGVILWMHTFSPAKMWINGLKTLSKPVLHLHTQFNKELPWDTIDMDFMNLNQAAHGDREAGHLHTRLRMNRKVVVGHWSQEKCQEQIASWSRVVAGWHDLQGAKFARFGDNMRYVSVTDGDKVAAEIKFGFSVNGYGISELAAAIGEISDTAVGQLCEEYEDRYVIAPELRSNGSKRESLREGARIEAGLRAFLKSGNFKGFTTTFEDLHGLKQLPGLAVQRLMNEGYGFGAEGDWKTCALLRAMKTMGRGLSGRTSFMEDYTYHLDDKNPLVLGSHMLEVCESIAGGKPSLEVHPLGIGGKADPVRLVFNAPAGRAINASLVDLGNRFRLIVNEVEAIDPPHALPKLPVARAVWKCLPDFETAICAWIQAGGAHHTAFSYDITTDMMQSFADIAGIEVARIEKGTTLHGFMQGLRSDEIYYHLAPGLGRM